MQTRSRLFDDFAKVASGAATAVVGIKQEIESMVRQQVERLASELDLARRDELEAVKAMAAKARAEQDRLEQRINELEARIASADEAAPKDGDTGSDATTL